MSSSDMTKKEIETMGAYGKRKEGTVLNGELVLKSADWKNGGGAAQSSEACK